MTHFALICPPFASHVRTFEALAEALVRRGHRATFVLQAGAEPLVLSRRIAVRTVGEEDADGARLEEIVLSAARPTGPFGILRTVRDAARLTDALCREAPAILRALRVEAVIGDEMEPAAGLLAGHLGLPLVSLASALPLGRDAAIPPPYLDWPYDPSPEGLKRNRGGERVVRLLLGRQRRTIRRWAERFSLPDHHTAEDCLSRLAQIAQTTPGFDFPRERAGVLRPVGPIRPAGGEDAALPFARDPRRPLVFASLGTLQGHRLSLFKAVAEGTRALGCQLVVAHCGRLTAEEAGEIDADLVTDFLPQRAVLRQAEICVTHAGLNTVLDALEAGVPILAIPIAFDQPGVSARVVHHGVGLRLSRVLLSSGTARASLERLLGQAAFRERAERLGREIRASGGREEAADIVENAVAAWTRQPEPAV